MSEEEKKAIEKLKWRIQVEKISIDMNIHTEEDYECFSTILNYIDKLQNENSSLKKEIRLMKSVNINDNFIPKETIKAKIKELEEDKKGYEEEGFENMKFATEITIIVLKELLGDDNNGRANK